MSWAEVKKINSNMMMPLDMQALLNHVDLVGDSYNPLSDIDQMLSAMNYDSLYGSEICAYVFGRAFWDYVINSNTNVGKTIGRAFSIQDPVLLICNSWTQVLDSETALASLRPHRNFFASMQYVDKSVMEAIDGTGQLVTTRNPGLVNAIGTYPALSDALQDTHITSELIANALNANTFFAARTTTNYTVPAGVSGATLIAVAPGESGKGDYGGGDGGKYLQKYVTLKPSSILDMTISLTGTTCNALSLNMSPGGGAKGGEDFSSSASSLPAAQAIAARKVGKTPTQKGKLIKVATGGQVHVSATGDSDRIGSGGGGGYGGGGGGGSSRAAGGTGPQQLPLVTGTGSRAGSANSYTTGCSASSDGGGGGGGGGYGSKSTKAYGGGGGGGYGGGGGGQGYHEASSTYAQGGSGFILLLI